MTDQVLMGTATMLVMLGWVAFAAVVLFIGKKVLDAVGDRVYGRMNKKRPGGNRGA